MDRASLYYTLMEVPLKVVKHLHRVAQVGYDKSRLQMEAARGEADEQALETEVRLFATPFLLCPALHARTVCVPGPIPHLRVSPTPLSLPRPSQPT
jgi:hypothetical protein